VNDTRFTEPAAVDAWDAWFRWRSSGELCDRTIDATWARVARAVAAVEGDAAMSWTQRFIDAFSRWQMLPGEALLASAGTGVAPAVRTTAAVLNVAAFVRAPGLSTARIDRDRLREAAALAVRLVDDAAIGLAREGTAHAAPRIGLIGFANALVALGIGYTDAAAVPVATAVASALAEGCLEGAVALARERGETEASDRGALAARWRALGVSGDSVRALLHDGVRYGALTAIDPHPRLARFANDVADSVDPMASSLPGATTSMAQLAIRVAIRRWIDRPIERPLVEATLPDIATRQACFRYATLHDLPEPHWRIETNPPRAMS
jgi:ribonucleoside-diphosphate reductase alpha chain